MSLIAVSIFSLIQANALGPTQPAVRMGDGSQIVSMSSSDAAGNWKIDVYVRPDFARPEPGERFQPLFFAQFSRGEDEGGRLREVRWADSRDCPKVFGILSAVEDLVAPRFDVGNLYGVPPMGAEVPPPRAVPTDAAGARIEGRARQPDGSMAYMSLSDAQGPITTAAMFGFAQLESCWSETPPDFITQ